MKIINSILILLISSSIYAQDFSSFLNKADSFFEGNVKDGKIDYKGIKKNPNAITDLLDQAKSLRIDESNEAEFQSFWINAYNLAVIKGVVDAFPIKSPLDVQGFFDVITYELAGKTVTLNEIENDLLRARFKDARIHFVLVCGALGCPPIIPEAYRPNTLEAKLTEQTQKAVNGDFLKVNKKKKRVEGSEILKWYKEDFIQDGMTELDYLNTYRTEIIPDNFKLTYFSYNWQLNIQ